MSGKGPDISSVPGTTSSKRQSRYSPPSTQYLCPMSSSLFGRHELGGFGRFGERDGRRQAAGDCGGDGVEIAGADLALMAGGGVAGGFGHELGLLQLGVSRHTAVAIA